MGMVPVNRRPVGDAAARRQPGNAVARRPLGDDPALRARLALAQQILSGFSVDWGFVAENEGALIERGYIPRNRAGTVIGNSGVTISTGFDIGQHTAAEIEAFDFPPALEARLLPYAALGPGRPRARENAQAALNATPLVITRLEAEVIAAVVKAAKAVRLERAYNRAARVPLRNLLREFQTVIFDVAFQYGTGFGQVRGTAAVPARKRLLWDEFTAQQWREAQQSLQWLGENEGYGPRRRRQRQLLETGILQLPPAAPRPGN